jgi:hypothetical protein
MGVPAGPEIFIAATERTIRPKKTMYPMILSRLGPERLNWSHLSRFEEYANDTVQDLVV